MDIGLQEMLIAREERAARQRALIDTYGVPVISFTMNIAGPEKNSPLITRGFYIGRNALIFRLKAINAEVKHSEEYIEPTGCEAFICVNFDAATLKKALCDIEDYLPAGRLFDIDVIDTSGRKISRPDIGMESRKCLICGEDAAVCARSRRHSVAELQLKTREILSSAVRNDDISAIGAAAQRALLYELSCSPKPGLVDRFSSGSHKDMDFYTFIDSAVALRSYFEKCAAAGIDSAGMDAQKCFELLRSMGRLAEGEMLMATCGVNTHKGAIFSLGIICAALGRLGREKWNCPGEIGRECSKMTGDLMFSELSAINPDTAATAGEKIYAIHGTGGARAQAAAGFPAAIKTGLPALKAGLHLGYSLDRAAYGALLAIMSVLDDTNMIKRGGESLSNNAAEKIRSIIAVTPYPDADTLLQLDREFSLLNLSPGGSADMLAAAFLLLFAENMAL